jgi:ATP-dependent DNA ligase
MPMNPRYGPRPKGKILPSQLGEHEKSGEWLIQRKFNGSKATIFFDQKNLLFFNKGSLFKKYSFPSFFGREFSTLNLKGECWLDGELLDPLVKDKIVLYDILQYNGNYLIDLTQEERLNLLGSLIVSTPEPEHKVALRATEHIWLAEHWASNFEDRFKDFLHLDLIEGLMLRRKRSRLSDFGFRPSETNDQVRCRKGNRKYRW